MGFDAVGAVEAAYDLDSTDHAWLEELTKRIQPVIAPRQGVIAVLADGRSMVPPEPMQVLGMAGFDVTEAMVASLQYMSEYAAKSREVGEQILAAGPVATLSERLGALFEEVRPELRRRGIEESLVLLGGEAWGRMCTISAPRPDGSRLSRPHRLVLEQFAAHLAVATRLREMGQVPIDDARNHAILSANGKVHEARGAAQKRSSLELLRSAARDHERARGSLRRRDPEEALALWRGLVAGRWSLLDSFESDGRRFLVARENPPRLARRLALTAAETRVAQLAAQGHATKLIAYELGVTSASAAMHLRRAMAKLGLKRRSDLARVVMRAPSTDQEG